MRSVRIGPVAAALAILSLGAQAQGTKDEKIVAPVEREYLGAASPLVAQRSGLSARPRLRHAPDRG